jgi:hypothetical protein
MMNEYMTFAIVRNPFKRVESLYRFWGYDSAIPFKTFVMEVLDNELAAKGPNYWFFRPQSEFISDVSGEVAIEHIIKLEEIDLTLPSVLSRTGIDVSSVPHVNKSKIKTKYFQSLKKRARHARNNIGSLSFIVNSEVIWSEEATEKVVEMYCHDFHLLGYS